MSDILLVCLQVLQFLTSEIWVITTFGSIINSSCHSILTGCRYVDLALGTPFLHWARHPSQSLISQVKRRFHIFSGEDEAFEKLKSNSGWGVDATQAEATDDYNPERVRWSAPFHRAQMASYSCHLFPELGKVQSTKSTVRVQEGRTCELENAGRIGGEMPKKNP